MDGRVSDNIFFVENEIKRRLFVRFAIRYLCAVSGAVFVLLSVTSALISVESSYRPGSQIRFTMFLILLIIALITAVYPAAVFLKDMIRYRRDPRPDVSGLDSCSVEAGILLIYDLSRKQDLTELGAAALDSLVQKYRKHNRIPLFPKTLFKKGQYYRMLISGVLLLYLVLGQGTGSSFYRIASYGKDFTPPPSHRLKISERTYSAAEGDSLELACIASGASPDNIILRKRYVNRDQFSSLQIPASNDTLFAYRVAEHQSFYFYFESSETRSDTAFAAVYKRPEVSEMLIRVTPPAYTKLPERDYGGIIPGISAYKGSNISFRITSSVSETDSVIMSFDQGMQINMSKNSDRVFSAAATVRESTAFGLDIFKNYEGFEVKNINSPLVRIDMMQDEHPTVNLIYPENGYMIGNDLQIPLFSTAADDFEITSVYLFMRKISFNEFTGKEDRSEYIRTRITDFEDREGVVIVNKYVSAGELRLFPEDRVELFLRVYDNDTVSGPKYTDSKTRTVVLPSLQKLLTESDKNYQRQDTALKEELERNRSVLDEINQMTEKLKMNMDLNWEDRKKLGQIIESQEQMTESLRDLEKDIEKNISMLEENTLLSEETMNKYMKLQKLVDDLFTKEMKDKLRELSELNESGNFDRESMSEFLKDFENEQKKFSEGLEKSLQILEQIKSEYILDRLLKQIDELITRQREINDSVLSKDPQRNENISKQKAAQASYDFFEKDLEKSSEEVKSADLKGVMDLVKDKDLKSDYSDMLTSMEDKDDKSSAATGNEIISKLMEVKGSVAGAKDEMTQRQKDELNAEIQAVISDLLLISELIEDLKNFSKGLSPASAMAPDVIRRYDRIRSLFSVTSEKIFDISQRTFFIDRMIIARIGRIEESFFNLSGQVLNRNFSTAYQGKNVQMGGINIVAVMLMDAARDLEQSDSPSGLDEMLKKMEELAKKQSMLNSQTSSMQSGGEQSMSQMQEMMNRLAMEQAQLYEALSRMMEGMGSQKGEDGSPGEEGSPGQGMSGQGTGGQSKPGPGSQPGTSGAGGQGEGGEGTDGTKRSELGKKLGDIAGDMKDVETMLRDKQLDESLLAKQNELMNKFLDAIESVKRERFENRREGRTGRLRAVDPGTIDLKNDRNLRELMLRSLRDGYTNTYKNKIREYFRELDN